MGVSREPPTGNGHNGKATQHGQHAKVVTDIQMMDISPRFKATSLLFDKCQSLLQEVLTIRLV